MKTLGRRRRRRSISDLQGIEEEEEEEAVTRMVLVFLFSRGENLRKCPDPGREGIELEPTKNPFLPL